MRQMKVLVNAASVKEGGPLVALYQLLRRMRQRRDDIDWALALHPRIGRDWNPNKDFEQVDVGGIDEGVLGVLRWYEVGLPAAVKRVKADLVFSVTNYLPWRRLNVPTVLLVQHAGHFSQRFDRLMRQNLRRPDRIAAWAMKTRWVERSVRTASEVTVQTVALADAVATKTGRHRARIHAIAHGPGAVASGLAVPCKQSNPSGGPVRLGYITKWGVQKNFGVLLGAAVRLLKEERDIRVVLTLAEHLPENARVIAAAKAAGLGEVLENAGEVEAARVAGLYDSLDVFVFPSLVESFGFPLVEAMARGLPVVVADTPSNREIAGSAGLFFAATDAAALAGILSKIIGSAALRETLSAASLQRAADFSWDLAAERTLALFDAALQAPPRSRAMRERQ